MIHSVSDCSYSHLLTLSDQYQPQAEVAMLSELGDDLCADGIDRILTSSYRALTELPLLDLIGSYPPSPKDSINLVEEAADFKTFSEIPADTASLLQPPAPQGCLSREQLVHEAIRLVLSSAPSSVQPRDELTGCDPLTGGRGQFTTLDQVHKWLCTLTQGNQIYYYPQFGEREQVTFMGYYQCKQVKVMNNKRRTVWPQITGISPLCHYQPLRGGKPGNRWNYSKN
ncbi:MAG: hypothetical protein WCF19_00130 [Chlamydiales bacterium]